MLVLQLTFDMFIHYFSLRFNFLRHKRFCWHCWNERGNSPNVSAKMYISVFSAMMSTKKCPSAKMHCLIEVVFNGGILLGGNGTMISHHAHSPNRKIRSCAYSMKCVTTCTYITYSTNMLFFAPQFDNYVLVWHHFKHSYIFVFLKHYAWNFFESGCLI